MKKSHKFLGLDKEFMDIKSTALHWHLGANAFFAHLENCNLAQMMEKVN